MIFTRSAFAAWLVCLSFKASAHAVRIDAIPNILQVTPDLYRGGRPLDSDLAELVREKKIRLILDLENLRTPIAHERQTAETLQVPFESIAMSPFFAPEDAAVDHILTQLKDPSHYPIYLHCHHGEDRTGLLIGLYRIRVQGWTPKQAYQEMLKNGFHPILKGLDSYFRKKTGYRGI